MADPKKAPPKAPAPAAVITPSRVFITLIAFMIILTIVERVVSSIDFQVVSPGNPESPLQGIYYVFSTVILPALKTYAAVISAVCFVGTFIVGRKMNALAAAQKAKYENPADSEAIPEDAGAYKNERWERVVAHMNSANPNDWKFAILEADIILGELLEAMSYQGETIADRLKRVERSDMRTLEAAWEAHKVRNVIAHEGGDFVITEREARRVVGLYREVFEEFHYI